jgi:hypothetical protein
MMVKTASSVGMASSNRRPIWRTIAPPYRVTLQSALQDAFEDSQAA